MYLILTASKDTYVTNRKLSSNDAQYANVGNAASLDLFKLRSENKLVKAQAVLTIKSIPKDNTTITLVDATGTSRVYKYVNGGNDFADKEISKQGTLLNVVDNTFSVINGSNQTFEAVEKSNNTIILEQKTSGFNGERSNTQSDPETINVTDFSIKEFSKILLRFNYDKIKKHFSIDSNKDFSAKLRLFDISTGQVKPKNFSINVFPLSQSFDEGIGKDIYSFGHRGWSNFLTASRDDNTLAYNTWNISGLRSKGSRGDLNIDIITGSNNVDYNNNQLFVNGDEDLSIDITNLISESLSGDLNNNGLALEFSSAIDQNSNTYFVKRFGSRHLKNKLMSPRLDFSFDDSFTKPDNIIYTNTPTRIYLENKQGNFNKNLYFTASNILDTTKNQLSASLSYKDFKTTVYATQSLDSLGQQKSGSYYVDFNVDMFANHLHGYLTGSGEIEASLKWHILVDENSELNTLVKDTTIKISTGSNLLQAEKFLISDIRFNFSKSGSKNQKNFFVSFIDTIANLDAIKIPYRRKGENLGEVYYSVIDVNSNKTLIPFETDKKGTKMSYEDGDYYFTLFSSELFKDKQIKFKFFLKDFNNLIIDNDKTFRI